MLEKSNKCETRDLTNFRASNVTRDIYWPEWLANYYFIMGGCMSRKEIPDEIYRYWSAVASSLRLGWLGTNNVRTVSVTG